MTRRVEHCSRVMFLQFLFIVLCVCMCPVNLVATDVGDYSQKGCQCPPCFIVILSLSAQGASGGKLLKEDLPSSQLCAFGLLAQTVSISGGEFGFFFAAAFGFRVGGSRKFCGIKWNMVGRVQFERKLPALGMFDACSSVVGAGGFFRMRKMLQIVNQQLKQMSLLVFGIVRWVCHAGGFFLSFLVEMEHEGLMLKRAGVNGVNLVEW